MERDGKVKMDRKEIRKWLDKYESCFRSKDKRQRILLTLEWQKGFPAEAGVYVVFNGDKIVYVGETGSIRGRMADLRHTRNHTMRRSIGASEFANDPEYKKASSLNKFPPRIECMVVEFLRRLEVTALPIGFGRKEIEENLIAKHHPLYNQKSKRGGA